MVKVWDLETGTEKKSLGGHTESVTSLVLLTQENSEQLGLKFIISVVFTYMYKLFYFGKEEEKHCCE